MIETLQFESQITEVKKINPLFSTCTIRVMYAGENRNNSIITKQAVEDALPTIYNIPIVGEYIENNEDFGGHGGKIEITDNDIKFVRTTMPYGVVPESANIHWENVEEDNGIVHQYLVIDGAFLWSGRYPEVDRIIEQGNNQSMEIEILDGNFTNDDKFDITKFVFSGLCILGEDVEPCFESASISSYTLDKDEFKRQFNQMISELKFSLNGVFKDSQEGGNKVEKEKEFEAEVESTEEEFKAKVDDAEEEKSEPVDDDAEESQENMAKNEQPVVDPDGDGDNDADPAENDDVDKDNKDPKAYELEKAEFEAKITELEKQLGELQVKFNALEEETNGLREFKHEIEKAEKETAIAEVFESVNSELTEDELAPLKEKAFEMDVEDLKKELFALIGRKTFSAKKDTKEKGKISMGIFEFSKADAKNESSYAHIIAKYNN